MASADNKKNRQSSNRQSTKGGQPRRGTATASRSTKQEKAVKDGKPKGGVTGRWQRSKERARQTASPKAAQRGEKRGLRKFIKDVRVELRKVTWPTRKDLFQSTLVVLVAVAISGAFIAALDFIFSRLTSVLP